MILTTTFLCFTGLFFARDMYKRLGPSSRITWCCNFVEVRHPVALVAILDCLRRQIEITRIARRRDLPAVDRRSAFLALARVLRWNVLSLLRESRRPPRYPVLCIPVRDNSTIWIKVRTRTPPILLKSCILTYFDVLNTNMTMTIGAPDILKVKHMKSPVFQ